MLSIFLSVISYISKLLWGKLIMKDIDNIFVIKIGNLSIRRAQDSMGFSNLTRSEQDIIDQYVQKFFVASMQYYREKCEGISSFW
jgi:hypothetical protein